MKNENEENNEEEDEEESKEDTEDLDRSFIGSGSDSDSAAGWPVW